MLYFTASYGEQFTSTILPGLIQSFIHYNPTKRLFVYCQEPQLIDRFSSQIDLRHFDLENALSLFDPEFYRRGKSHRNDVFKLALFRELSRDFPGETCCWLDADSLIFGDLDLHFKNGLINVVHHGRRDGEILDLGNDLRVNGERFAIGGVYSLPSLACIDEAIEIANQRAKWKKQGTYWSEDGDQITLNHLISRHGELTRFVTEDRRFIYNLSYHQGLHPYLGDPMLRRISTNGEKIVLDDREVVIFLWTQATLAQHIEERFSSFRPDVRRRLLDFYGIESRLYPRIFYQLRKRVRR